MEKTSEKCSTKGILNENENKDYNETQRRLNFIFALFTLLNKKIPNWRVQRLALFFARGHKISNMGKMNSKNLLVVKLSKKNYHFNLYPDKNFTKVKSTISGLNRKCVGGPKNNTHF